MRTIKMKMPEVWLVKDKPELIPSNAKHWANRIKVHEKLTCFCQMTDQNKFDFRKIKSILERVTGITLIISCFGSRVNGNFNDESDYDITIHKSKLQQSDLKSLKQELLNYNYVTDIWLSESFTGLEIIID